MNDQIPSPNTPAPAERPVGFTPEALQPAAAPAPAETAPVPGGGAPAPTSDVAVPAKLTAADVAAALATTNAPGATPGVIPAPQFAGDVDVIEPEWVAKAEEVVKAHSGDPYAEEEAIEELQQDYLQKRYGIAVSDPNADNSKPKGV